MRERLTELIRTIRTHVCTTCYRRPPGSERWTRHTARPCEGDCTIFATTPLLLRIAEMGGANARASMERAVSNAACMDNHACGSTAEGHINCLCALRLTEDKIGTILDTLIKPAEGAD